MAERSDRIAQAEAVKRAYANEPALQGMDPKLYSLLTTELADRKKRSQLRRKRFIQGLAGVPASELVDPDAPRATTAQDLQLARAAYSTAQDYRRAQELWEREKVLTTNQKAQLAMSIANMGLQQENWEREHKLKAAMKQYSAAANAVGKRPKSKDYGDPAKLPPSLHSQAMKWARSLAKEGPLSSQGIMDSWVNAELANQTPENRVRMIRLVSRQTGLTSDQIFERLEAANEEHWKADKNLRAQYQQTIDAAKDAWTKAYETSKADMAKYNAAVAALNKEMKYIPSGPGAIGDNIQKAVHALTLGSDEEIGEILRQPELFVGLEGLDEEDGDDMRQMWAETVSDLAKKGERSNPFWQESYDAVQNSPEFKAWMESRGYEDPVMAHDRMMDEFLWTRKQEEKETKDIEAANILSGVSPAGPRKRAWAAIRSQLPRYRRAAQEGEVPIEAVEEVEQVEVPKEDDEYDLSAHRHLTPEQQKQVIALQRMFPQESMEVIVDKYNTGLTTLGKGEEGLIRGLDDAQGEERTHKQIIEEEEEEGLTRREKRKARREARRARRRGEEEFEPMLGEELLRGSPVEEEGPSPEVSIKEEEVSDADAPKHDRKFTDNAGNVFLAHSDGSYTYWKDSQGEVKNAPIKGLTPKTKGWFEAIKGYDPLFKKQPPPGIEEEEPFVPQGPMLGGGWEQGGATTPTAQPATALAVPSEISAAQAPVVDYSTAGQGWWSFPPGHPRRVAGEEAAKRKREALMSPMEDLLTALTPNPDLMALGPGIE